MSHPTCLAPQNGCSLDVPEESPGKIEVDQNGCHRHWQKWLKSCPDDQQHKGTDECESGARTPDPAFLPFELRLLSSCHCQPRYRLVNPLPPCAMSTIATIPSMSFARHYIMSER